MRYNLNDIIRDNPPYYRSKIYPTIPVLDTDIYMVTSIGARLDLYANNFYKDPNKWWLIAMTNPELDQSSIYVPAGFQLRISIDPQYVLDIFNRANSIR